MSEHDPFPPEQGSRTEGPFSDQYHVLIVDGRRVPNVQVYPHDDGTVGVLLDGRWWHVFDDGAQVLRMAPLLANAMAISAGYSHFGAESKERPFAPRMIGVTAIHADCDRSPLQPELHLVRQPKEEKP